MGSSRASFKTTSENAEEMYWKGRTERKKVRKMERRGQEDEGKRKEVKEKGREVRKEGRWR